jgi:hypothetical protein
MTWPMQGGWVAVHAFQGGKWGGWVACLKKLVPLCSATDWQRVGARNVAVRGARKVGGAKRQPALALPAWLTWQRCLAVLGAVLAHNALQRLQRTSIVSVGGRA